MLRCVKSSGHFPWQLTRPPQPRGPGLSFTNALNRVNLGIPDMTFTDANNPSKGLCGFGCITSAQGLYQFAGAPRCQIGARIEF